MVFDLRPYGFKNTVLSDDLIDISYNLPHWSSMYIPHRKQFDINLSIEYFSLPIKDSGGNDSYPVYIWGKKIDEGTYGKVYTCLRKAYHDLYNGKIMFSKDDIQNFESIVIKETPLSLSDKEKRLPYEKQKAVFEEEFKAHLHEAAVLSLAYTAAKQNKISLSIPKIYEIFIHKKSAEPGIESVKSVCIAMEYIQGETLQKFLLRNFDKTNRVENDRIFLNLLKQMAIILDVLQVSLRMNHRDIKINNILIRDPYSSKPVLVLIDYGFACIANGIQDPMAEMSQIQAGSFFGSRFSCFKHGRDIFQYIYSIHCYYPLQNYLSEKLFSFVTKWMSLDYEGRTVNLLNGVAASGSPLDVLPPVVVYNEGIYNFLKKPNIDPIICSPKNVIAEIENYLNM
jgi:serine/threonine protein kinase